jgi:nuclear transport factor 2 (NTF2) superfamily protein
MTREDLERAVRTYYDGCNEADADKMAACFAPDAVHYFPAGAAQGTFAGASAIATGWQRAVETLGSQWTIDRLSTDLERREVTVEWTHWKTARGGHLRGAEICRFDEAGLMTEIRAYYAAPASGHDAVHELGDFDYAGRDYPLAPPARR